MEENDVSMPSHQDLRKLSDEHKAMLAQKCVSLLLSNYRKMDTPTITSVAATSAGESDGTRERGEEVGGAWELPAVVRRRTCSRPLMAAPPLCIPEVSDKTYVKG